jgi:para-nitrobenzyl esterase
MHLNPEDSGTSGSDFALSEAIWTYWTNFAKYGYPNGEGVHEWPTFSDEDPNVMFLTGPTPFIGEVPSHESLEVLDEYFRWRRTPEGKAWAQ